MLDSSTNGHAYVVIPACNRREERRALDARVLVETAAGPLRGWSLNVSSGGIRVLVVHEDLVSIAAAFKSERVTVCIDGYGARPARLAWCELCDGGALLGVAFDGSVLPLDVRPAYVI